MALTLSDVTEQVRELIGDFRETTFTDADILEAINWAQDLVVRNKGFKIGKRLYPVAQYPTGQFPTDLLSVKRVQIVESVTPYDTAFGFTVVEAGPSISTRSSLVMHQVPLGVGMAPGWVSSRLYFGTAYYGSAYYGTALYGMAPYGADDDTQSALMSAGDDVSVAIVPFGNARDFQLAYYDDNGNSGIDTLASESWNFATLTIMPGSWPTPVLPNEIASRVGYDLDALVGFLGVSYIKNTLCPGASLAALGLFVNIEITNNLTGEVLHVPFQCNNIYLF